MTLPFNCTGAGNLTILRYADLRLVCRPPSTPSSSLPHIYLLSYSYILRRAGGLCSGAAWFLCFLQSCRWREELSSDCDLVMSDRERIALLNRFFLGIRLSRFTRGKVDASHTGD